MLKCALHRICADDANKFQSQIPISSQAGMSLTPGIRKAPQPLTFSFVYRVKRVAKRHTASGLDLDDADCVVSLSDDVNLAL